MDVLSQRKLEFSDEDTYAEKHCLFRLFQHILEKLIVNRPDDPTTYVRQLLLKGFQDVQRVLLLGSPGTDRKLLTSTLEMKLKLVHLTRNSFVHSCDPDLQEKLDMHTNLQEVPPQLWADIMKRRVEKSDCLKCGYILEGFPKTRSQAFCMLKAGIFPTHIVFLEPSERHSISDHVDVSSVEDSEESREFKLNSSLLTDFFSQRHTKTFRNDGDFNKLVRNVEEFVRDKEMTFTPYVPRVLLFGPPGSGKRTLSSMLASKYPLQAVGIETLLRQAATNEGAFQEELQEILSTDDPVSDELLARIAAMRLRKDDCIENGWILFDFPFNEVQAASLTEQLSGFQVNKAIFLEASLQTSLQRSEACFIEDEHRDVSIADFRRRIEELYYAYQSHCALLQGYYARNLSEDIVFCVNVDEEKLDSLYEVLEGVILSSSKRKVPPSEWFESSARNTGIY